MVPPGTGGGAPGSRVGAARHRTGAWAPATAPRRGTATMSDHERYDAGSTSPTRSEGPPDRPVGPPAPRPRISVTDRCNFRCTYCMPKEIFGRDYAFLPRDQVLTFEEITRTAPIFVSLGVEKLRITGGEPTVRRDLARTRPHARRDRGRARPHADDEWVRARTLAAPLAGRAAPDHGQPRFARRRGLPGDERCRHAGRPGPRRDRAAGVRARTGQGQHGRQAAAATRRRSSRWRAGLRDAASFCAHRVHGRRRQQRLAHGRCRPLGGDHRARRCGVPARGAAGELPGRGRHPSPLPRREQARSA